MYMLLGFKFLHLAQTGLGLKIQFRDQVIIFYSALKMIEQIHNIDKLFSFQNLI